MDKILWLKLIRNIITALIVAVVIFIVFSKVIKEDEINNKELYEIEKRLETGL